MTDRTIGIIGIVAVAMGILVLDAFQWQIVEAPEGTALRLNRFSGRIDRCIPDNVEVRQSYASGLLHCDGSDPAMKD